VEPLTHCCFEPEKKALKVSRGAGSASAEKDRLTERGKHIGATMVPMEKGKNRTFQASERPRKENQGKGKPGLHAKKKSIKTTFA